MSLIDHALHRSRTVLSVLVLLLVSGTVAYIGIPKESDPDITIPKMYVTLTHDGISPEDAERLLVRPVEEKLRSIEGINEMISWSYEGGGNILLEFDAGFDADSALDDVRERVDQAKPELPVETDEPKVKEINISEFPVIVVTLSGPVPERTLLRLVRQLQDSVEAIPAVLEAKIAGDRKEQVEIVADPVLVESYALDPEQIALVITRFNQLIAAGAMDTGQGRFSVKVPGVFESVRDVMEMPVKVDGDAVVTIGDVATVQRGFKDATSFARVDGEPALALEISKRTGENVIDTIAAIRGAVEAARASWPDVVELTYSQDRSKDIRLMLGDLQNNVISAVLLVMIVVIAALGVRSGLVVGLAIPGSFLTGILVIAAMGLTVNIVVLFALILAVGMLVDGAIVVSEYADRKMTEGEPQDRAYALAAKRMAWPIIASTATTLAAFMPLLFWPGIVGEFMKFLPITLLATLSASLLMALVFLPVVGANLGALARILLTFIGAAGGAGIAGMVAFGGMTQILGSPAGLWTILATAIFALAGLIGGAYLGLRAGGMANHALTAPPPPAEMEQMKALAADGHVDPTQIKGVTGAYVQLLDQALRRPGLVLLAAVVFMAATWVSYGLFGEGKEFFPDVEPDRAIIQVHARGNLSIREQDSLVAEVERHVLDIAAERDEFVTIYTTSGPLTQRGEGAEDIIGRVRLEFAEWDQRRPASEILADVQSRAGDIPGIIIEPRKEESGPPGGKPIHIELSGLDVADITAAAVMVRAHLETLPDLKDFEDGLPVPGIEWQLAVDHEQAARFGADVAVIGWFVQMVTKGLKVSSYRPDDSDDELDIVLRFPTSDRTIDQLDRIRIRTELGMIPISNFVERSASQKTGTLQRTDGRRVIPVKADVIEGVNTDRMVGEIRDWMATAPLPAGVSYVFKGEDKEQAEAAAFLMKAFSVALFMMAIILVTQFNSFYSGLLILSAVIMSTVGVFLGLLITGQPFGIVMSGVGVIALAGIVVNNNIVLIDTFDRLHADEPDIRLAILRTGAQRLRPVILTTVTTILGLMPMVLSTNINFVTREISIGAPSTQWWTQLSTAIAFGLAFATVLTLVVTPSALMLRGNVRAWLDRRAENRAEPAAAMVQGTAE